jgi:hypothetical protein
MNYFLELIEKQDDFCVNHSKLYEYNVINMRTDKNKNQKEDSKVIEKCLVDDNQFVEGEDYLVHQVMDSRLPKQHGGFNGNKKEYILKPKTFKFCLMRSKNCKNYSKYYLLLEEMYLYFTKYEKAYKDVLLSGKDCKINNLISENKKQTEMIQKQSSDIKTLMKYAENTNLMIEDLDNSIKVISPERNINPKNESKINYFCLLKISDSYEYQFVRGQKRHVDKILKSMKIGKTKKFPEGKVFSEVIIPSTFVPNSIDIIVKVKERFIKEFIKKIYFPVITENEDLDEEEKRELKFEERPFKLSGLNFIYKPNPYMKLEVFTKWVFNLLNENLEKDIAKIKK